jgi:hypothetical protein
MVLHALNAVNKTPHKTAFHGCGAEEHFAGAMLNQCLGISSLNQIAVMPRLRATTAPPLAVHIVGEL